MKRQNIKTWWIGRIHVWELAKASILLMDFHAKYLWGYSWSWSLCEQILCLWLTGCCNDCSVYFPCTRRCVCVTIIALLVLGIIVAIIALVVTVGIPPHTPGQSLPAFLNMCYSDQNNSTQKIAAMLSEYIRCWEHCLKHEWFGNEGWRKDTSFLPNKAGNEHILAEGFWCCIDHNNWTGNCNRITCNCQYPVSANSQHHVLFSRWNIPANLWQLNPNQVKPA